MKNVEALHSLVAAEDIGSRITLGVADMETGARRIREHVQTIKLLTLGVVIRLERLVLKPITLPLLLYLGKIIIAHYCNRSSAWAAMAFSISPVTSFLAADTPVLIA